MIRLFLVWIISAQIKSQIVDDTSLRHLLGTRLHHLRKFAKDAWLNLPGHASTLTSKVEKHAATNFHNETEISCSTQRYLSINGFRARAGNNFIQLSHGLWFATVTQRTFILPKNADALLVIFDAEWAKDLFCIAAYETEASIMATDTTNHPGIDYIQLETSDVYTGFNIWKVATQHPGFVDELPLLTEETLLDSVAVHTLIVAGAMWGNLREVFADQIADIAENYLGQSLSYVAIHKRSFEGGCEDWAQNSQQFAVNTRKFPLQWLDETHTAEAMNNTISLKGSAESLSSATPTGLCGMPLAMVEDICSMYNISFNYSYLCWDGEGSADDYVRVKYHGGNDEHGGKMKNVKPIPHVVIGREIAHGFNHNLMDLLMAMNAELFVMNPMSTWSWQVHALRRAQYDYIHPAQPYIYEDAAKLESPISNVTQKVAMVRTILGLRTVPALTALGPEGLIALMMLHKLEPAEGEQGEKPQKKEISEDGESSEDRDDAGHAQQQIRNTQLWEQYRQKFGVLD